MRIKEVQVLEGFIHKEWLVNFDFWKIYSEIAEAYGYILQNTTAPHDNPIKQVIMNVTMLRFMNKRIEQSGVYTSLDTMVRQICSVSSIIYLREIPDYMFYLVINT